MNALIPLGVNVEQHNLPLIECADLDHITAR